MPPPLEVLQQFQRVAERNCCWAPPPLDTSQWMPPTQAVFWCTQPKRNKAIPIMGSASGRGISAGTGELK